MTINPLRIVRVATLVAACLMLSSPGQALDLVSRDAPRTIKPAAAGPVLSIKSVRGLPHGARPLTGQELFELYVGKTWKWGEGGGYFGPHGVFRARTYGDDGPTRAGGTWGVNDKGRVCFRAVWTNAAGSARANSCFDHMVLGGDVYQRKAPDGEWYVFRHAVPAEGDEYGKFVPGNLVARAAAN